MPKRYNSNPFEDQLAFMQAAGQTAGVYNDEQLALYVDLIDEEFTEVVTSESLENFLKELADLLVVTIGAMYSTGASAQEVWNAVHESNMSKLTDGKLEKREDGKVLKGPTYKKANLHALVSRIQGLPEPKVIEAPIEPRLQPEEFLEHVTQ
jgi:predicted HAD superfamily Cof-like phosphohydrolase